MIALLFACAMIIGKAQEADAYLKFPLFAVLLLLGYLPLFYAVTVLLVRKLADTAGSQGGGKAPSGLTRWLFEDHVIFGVMLVVFLCRLPYLTAFYPCSMSWDGGAQICDFTACMIRGLSMTTIRRW